MEIQNTSHPEAGPINLAPHVTKGRLAFASGALIFIGPPGCGKGTHSAAVARALGIPTISTGKLVSEIENEISERGEVARDCRARGIFAPDELVADLICARIGKDDCRRGFILDGFPRNLTQAQTLNRILEERGLPLCVVVYIEVSDEIVRERISNRNEGRVDDDPVVVTKRLKVYHELTAPVVEYYRAKDLLLSVDGSGGKEEVGIKLMASLELELVRQAQRRELSESRKAGAAAADR